MGAGGSASGGLSASSEAADGVSRPGLSCGGAPSDPPGPLARSSGERDPADWGLFHDLGHRMAEVNGVAFCERCARVMRATVPRDNWRGWAERWRREGSELDTDAGRGGNGGGERRKQRAGQMRVHSPPCIAKYVGYIFL